MRVCLFVACVHLLGKDWPLCSRLWCIIWYATWQCYEKVDFWPIYRIPRVSGDGRVICGQNIWYHANAFAIPFNLICNMTTFWTKWILPCWLHPQGGVVGWYLGKYSLPCYCIRDSLNLKATWPSSKKVEFWPIDPSPRGRGSVRKIFATMLLHFEFPWLWYATWPCSEKAEIWPIDPPRSRGGGGRRSAGKIFATMLLHSLQHDHVLKKLNFDLLTQPQP